MILYIGYFLSSRLSEAGCRVLMVWVQASAWPGHGRSRAKGAPGRLRSTLTTSTAARNSHSQPARTPRDSGWRAGLLQGEPRAEPDKKGRETISTGLKRKAAAKCREQLVRRAQRAAAGTEQPGGLVEEAKRVEMIPPRIKAEEHQARSRGQQTTHGQNGVDVP